MSATVSVLVVDDHPAVRLGVLRLLETQSDLEPRTFASACEAVQAASQEHFDVAVVDYQLAEGEDGLSLTRELLRGPHPPRVLIYSAYADALLTALAHVAGADGILNKIALGDELCHAIREVVSGQARLPDVPGPIAFSLGRRLAPADRRLFSLWVGGAGDARVLEASGLAPECLEDRRREILTTLGGPPGRPRLPWDQREWPLSPGRARRLRGGC